MKQWTGQNLWRTDEQLPPDLLQRVSEGTGCDAVMFCQLTRFQPYQPLAVGWKFSLVQYSRALGATAQPQILWSADEVLDAGDPEVATAARNYFAQHLHNEAASADLQPCSVRPPATASTPYGHFLEPFLKDRQKSADIAKVFETSGDI